MSCPTPESLPAVSRPLDGAVSVAPSFSHIGLCLLPRVTALILFPRSCPFESPPVPGKTAASAFLLARPAGFRRHVVIQPNIPPSIPVAYICARTKPRLPLRASRFPPFPFFPLAPIKVCAARNWSSAPAQRNELRPSSFPPYPMSQRKTQQPWGTGKAMALRRSRGFWLNEWLGARSSRRLNGPNSGFNNQTRRLATRIRAAPMGFFMGGPHQR